MVLGGPQETGRLLEHKFDYIFFTGEGPAAGGQLRGPAAGGARDGRGERPEPSSTLGALSPAAGERLRGQR